MTGTIVKGEVSVDSHIIYYTLFAIIGFSFYEATDSILEDNTGKNLYVDGVLIVLRTIQHIINLILFVICIEESNFVFCNQVVRTDCVTQEMRFCLMVSIQNLALMCVVTSLSKLMSETEEIKDRASSLCQLVPTVFLINMGFVFFLRIRRRNAVTLELLKREAERSKLRESASTKKKSARPTPV